MAKSKLIRTWLERVRRFPLLAQLALGLGIAVHIVAFALLAIQRQGDVLPYEQKSFIAYTESQVTPTEVLLREQSSLFDPEPLLLHTAWNYRSPVDIDETLSGVESFFSRYPEQVSLENGLKAVTPAHREEVFSSQLLFDHLLSASSLGVFQGFATGMTAVPASVGEGIVVQLTCLRPGNLSRQITLPYAELGSEVQLLWSPVQLHVMVHPSRRVGDIWLTRGSGNADVDARLRVLAHEQMIRWKLPEGYYRIEIGP